MLDVLNKYYTEPKRVVDMWIILNSLKYGLPFYMQYLARWPEYFQTCESAGGRIMGYSKFN